MKHQLYVLYYRMVVMNTEDERVQLGSLYIITCKGGTVGSKGSHEVENHRNIWE